MKKNRIISIAIAGFIVLILAVGYWLYLSREYVINNPDLGILVYHYSWGEITRIECDVNRDGRIDAEYEVNFPRGGVLSTNFEIISGWESSRLDGCQDLRLEYSDLGLRILVDDDCDGVFERELANDDAEELLERRGGVAIPEPPVS